MTYDENNIFAKIIKGEIPCDKVYEDDFTLAFNDISPSAPVHVLVLPKGKYVSWNDFSQKASNEEITALHKAVFKVAEKTNITQTGYRVISNCGSNGGQEVPHLHLHVLGGKDIGPLVSK